MFCRLEKSRWWERGRMACSPVILPTPEIRGVKSEVTLLIRCRTGILNLASPKSETQAGHPLLSVFSMLSGSFHRPIQISHPLLPHLQQSCTQFAFIFVSLYKGSSMFVYLDVVPWSQQSGSIQDQLILRKQLGTNFMQWKILQSMNPSLEQKSSNFGAHQSKVQIFGIHVLRF